MKKTFGRVWKRRGDVGRWMNGNKRIECTGNLKKSKKKLLKQNKKKKKKMAKKQKNKRIPCVNLKLKKN